MRGTIDKVGIGERSMQSCSLEANRSLLESVAVFPFVAILRCEPLIDIRCMHIDGCHSVYSPV